VSAGPDLEMAKGPPWMDFFSQVHMGILWNMSIDFKVSETKKNPASNKTKLELKTELYLDVIKPNFWK
jgi:hypothetical protein